MAHFLKKGNGGREWPFYLKIMISLRLNSCAWSVPSIVAFTLPHIT